MAVNDQTLIGLANRFSVTVVEQSQYDLGTWQKAEGLDVSWDVPDYRAGDTGNQRWFFPANTKYKTVKLVRAANQTDSPKVKEWLTANSFTYTKSRGIIVITLFDSTATKIMDWELKNALPRSWAINSMDAGASSVSIETLEIDHEGFLEDEHSYA
jgi:phage tail-like protein